MLKGIHEERALQIVVFLMAMVLLVTELGPLVISLQSECLLKGTALMPKMTWRPLANSLNPLVTLLRPPEIPCKPPSSSKSHTIIKKIYVHFHKVPIY